MRRSAEIILFNNPYRMLSEQRGEPGQPCLGDVPALRGWEAAGRLDFDSEGLVLLTDDGALQKRIADPRHKTKKVYLAQVERVPDETALVRLRRGVKLKDGMTAPAGARLVDEPEWLWPRVPPIRYRREIPTAWLEITLTEGRNRQVRRMTAAAGYPTLRLIRVKIGEWLLDGLRPGEWKKL